MHTSGSTSLASTLRGYLYVSPAGAVLGAFALFPLFYGFYLSPRG